MKGNQLLRKEFAQIIKSKNINSNYRGSIRTNFYAGMFYGPFGIRINS